MSLYKFLYLLLKFLILGLWAFTLLMSVTHILHLLHLM